ncbi:MAG: hypothetical protein PWQ67_996 [Clostridia bacterium]|jgi:uncharacterized protein YecA (UPF0149 family)|nr:hypothetical protein [Clostridia bacterium]
MQIFFDLIIAKKQRIIKKEFIERNWNKEYLIDRNDPCPCGSGKKYKKCCGK